jgi:hypothetical protein
MLEYQHVATPPAFLEGSHAIKVRLHMWEITLSFVAGSDKADVCRMDVNKVNKR